MYVRIYAHVHVLYVHLCSVMLCTYVHVHVYRFECYFTPSLQFSYMVTFEWNLNWEKRKGTCTCMHVYSVRMACFVTCVYIHVRVFSSTCVYRVVLLSRPLTIEALLDQLQAWFPGHRFTMYHYSTEVRRSPSHSPPSSLLPLPFYISQPIFSHVD